MRGRPGRFCLSGHLRWLWPRLWLPWPCRRCIRHLSGLFQPWPRSGVFGQACGRRRQLSTHPESGLQQTPKLPDSPKAEGTMSGCPVLSLHGSDRIIPERLCNRFYHRNADARNLKWRAIGDRTHLRLDQIPQHLGAGIVRVSLQSRFRLFQLGL